MLDCFGVWKSSQFVPIKVASYISCLDKLNLRDGLRVAMSVSAAANGFLTALAPWSLQKTDLVAASNCMHLAVQATSLIASLFSPFVPTFSEQLNAQLNLPLQKLRGNAFSFNVPANHRISNNVDTIIKQIEGDKILEWWEKYG